MSTIKVNKIENTATADGGIAIDASGHVQIDGQQLPTAGALSNRRINVNGAMTVAQRGTSSTETGYKCVDRWSAVRSGTDADPTQSQGTVASGTTPYSLGFRNTYKTTNGNQTSGAGTSDHISFEHRIEARDIATSGWDYTSTSSYLTVSYWAKSSVAQNFYVRVLTKDGTSKRYAFETGSLTADTWTKITKHIPGHADLQFDDDVGSGLEFRFYLFRGTDNTDSGVTLDEWATYNSAQNTPDQTSTWYTTNGATFEITGFQVEVGAKATAYEHKRFDDELRDCLRYFEKSYDYGTTPGTATNVGEFNLRKSAVSSVITDICPRYALKRATPTIRVYSPITGAEGKIASGGTDVTAAGGTIGEKGFSITTSSGQAANNVMQTHYTAESEL